LPKVTIQRFILKILRITATIAMTDIYGLRQRPSIDANLKKTGGISDPR